MTKLHYLTAAASAALACASLTRAAEPPGVMNHQGRIAVSGANYDGTGHFKFALVDGDPATQTLWSNDGTGTAGSEPTASVSTAVSSGHYAIALGGEGGMGAIPASVFKDNADVRLRVWFSTEGTSFEQLAPDRRITSAGYALNAGSAAGIPGLSSDGMRIGIGTTSPTELVHISGGEDPTLLLQSDGTDEISGRVAMRQSNGTGFDIFYDGTNANEGLLFEPYSGGTAQGASLFMDLSGNVGIGTTNPGERLHVSKGDSGSLVDSLADVIIEDNSSAFLQINAPDANAAGIYFGLSDDAKSGAIVYSAYDAVADTGKDLQFRTDGSTRLNIDKGGNVGIGTNTPAEKFVVSGNVKCTTAIITSDRDKKAGFAEVDPMEVLQKVADMPITRWHYKSDTTVDHVGPVAQDFHDAFGLGHDDKHIATVDADGIALAAIKGLTQVIDQKDQTIRDLEARLRRLEEAVLADR